MRAGVRDWLERIAATREGNGLAGLTPSTTVAGIAAAALCASVHESVRDCVREAGRFPWEADDARLAVVVQRAVTAAQRPRNEEGAPTTGDLPATLAADIATEIGTELAAKERAAAELRADIATMLRDIGAAEVALEAVARTSSAAAIGTLVARLTAAARMFAEFAFVLDDLREAARRIGDDATAALQELHRLEAAQQEERDRRREESLRLLRTRALLQTPPDLRSPDQGTPGRTSQAPGAAAPPPGEVCPYQGLAPFDAATADFFFGRAQATVDLVERLSRRLEMRPSILMVTGASGVGKSSLLRAGLMPALAKGMVPIAGSQEWPHLLLTPTADPLRRLAECCAGLYGDEPDDFSRRLRDDPYRALSRRPTGRGRFVLVVDQFEELFTLVSEESERQAYVQALHALAVQRAGAAVVIGVRSDYWDRCAAYPQFAEAIQDGQVIVEPMTESDLRLAIAGPAAAVGLEIDPGLVDTILDELRPGRDASDRYEPGALPMLSQALRNTWHERENGRLTLAGYERSGRVHGAVRHTADEVFERLGPTERTTALVAFRRMTVITSGGKVARRRATLAEIHAAVSAATDADRDQVTALLAAFADQRLVTLHENTVEIVHDALLTAWPNLRQWLEPDLAAQTLYDRLIRDATEWHDSRRDPDLLYRGDRLLSIQETRPRWERDPISFPPPGPVAESFLEASARAADRAQRRRRRVTAGLAVLSIIALVAAFAAVRAARTADRQRAVATSRQLAAQSQTLIETDPGLAALLAAAAWRIAPTAEARSSVHRVLRQPHRASLPGHSAGVLSVAFSPDGTTLATGSALFDDTLRLWDVATRRLRATLHTGHKALVGSVDAVVFSPDGRTLATGGDDGTVRLWDAATGRPLGAPLTGHRGGVDAVAFSPDGTLLASGGDDGTVRLWNLATRRQQGRALTGHRDDVCAVAFSPDGRTLASAGFDGTIRLWDVPTRSAKGAPLTGHDGRIRDMAFHPGGRTLATGGDDDTVRVWDLSTRRPSGPLLTGHDADVTAMAFSPDGQTLASGDAGGTIRLWDGTGRQKGAPLVGHAGGLRSLAFSPDGTTLASGADDEAARLWDVSTHRQRGRPLLGHRDDVLSVAFSPDGATLATGGSDDAVRLWNVASHTPRARLPRDRHSSVRAVAFSPDGKTLATADAAGVVRLWDAATRAERGTLRLRNGTDVRAVAFSPDGRTLATTGPRSTAQLWDVATRTGRGAPLTGHRATVNALAFSPDGATLATGAGDGTVRLWDTASGRPRGAPLTGHRGTVLSVAVSPDGKTLASGGADGTVRLWDMATRRPLGAPLIGHRHDVNAVAFSPDGASLATGGAGGAVLLWDMATRAQMGTPLTGHPGGVLTVAFSPDGATLATGSDDDSVRLWNVATPPDALTAICAIPGRTLSRQEWNLYASGEEFRRVCP